MPFLRERHPRPRHPARAARGGRGALLPLRRASARSTSRTAPCSRRSRADLAAHGVDLPVYWGNRNWDPYLTDVVAQMQADGVHRAACVRDQRLLVVLLAAASTARTSPTRSARASTTRPSLDRLRLVLRTIPASSSRSSTPSVEALGAATRRRRRALVFVTHSIPDTMDDGSGAAGRRLRRPAPRRLARTSSHRVAPR